MIKNGTIEIHQTLHGYKNGHELIAASVNLPLAVKRLLLVLSDLSGTSIQSGFEEYYTGYPLIDANSYALAKTWYAPEMERPGCVWTHTLIIAFADLALINNPESLITKFRRPNKLENTFEKYSYTLDLPLEEPIDQANITLPNNLAKYVINELYGQKNKAVLVADENGFRWDKFFLSTWLQQWPRLRRSFTFCSGAISPRYFQSSLFDLQIISNLARYDSLISPNSSKIIDVNSQQLKDSYPVWVDELYRDLKFPSILRRFLRRYGTDLLPTTSSVSVLVETFLFFENNIDPSLTESINFLATNFKKKNEGNLLKQTILFHDQKTTDLNIPYYKTFDALEALATSEFYLSFHFEKLELENRFVKLYEVETDSFFNLTKALITKPINKYGELLLISAAEIIRDLDLEYLLNNISVFFTLESINPKHCYKENVWKRLDKHQTEYLSLIFKSDEIYTIEWRKIIYIILKIRANINPESFIEKDIQIIPYVLSYVQTENDNLEYKWIIYLKNNSNEILSWLTQNDVDTIDFIHFIISLLNPNSQEVINFEVSTWSKLLHKFPKDYNLSSFVMAISLHKNSYDSVNLLAQTFENVYTSLYYNKLDYDCWRFLEPHTKPLSFYNDWDKCKKLVNAVARFFVDNKINDQAIEMLSDNPEVLKKISLKIGKYKK